MTEQINQLKSQREEYVTRYNELQQSIYKKIQSIMESTETAEMIDCKLNIGNLTTRIEGLEEAHEHLTK